MLQLLRRPVQPGIACEDLVDAHDPLEIEADLPT